MAKRWNSPTPDELLEIIEGLLEMLSRRESQLASQNLESEVSALVLDFDKLGVPFPDPRGILIVSASALTRDLLRRCFAQGGVEHIHDAATVDEALLSLAQRRSAVILVDCHDPGSGETRTDWISTIGAVAEGMLIAILPTASRDDLRAALMAGADELLVKPIDTVRLRAMVSAL
ncbi:MAG: response regulator, partial [bacterium]